MPLTSISYNFHGIRSHPDLDGASVREVAVGQSVQFAPEFQFISFEELRLIAYYSLGYDELTLIRAD